MPTRYQAVQTELRVKPRSWLVTGVAGFIGSHLLETLLRLDQVVVGLDNFATGHRRNLSAVETLVGPKRWSRFRFIHGDIRHPEVCRDVVKGARHVLHHAALGSVPWSLADPAATNEINVTGFLNLLIAARDESVTSFVYAASSATYGDHPGQPKVEDTIGNALSPYAVTKYVNELYADVFGRAYGFKSIGLRYFNVFGPRQDPDGPYAAVIPKWIGAMLKGDDVVIYGDGSTSRDFCYIDNAVQANLLAAVAEGESLGQVYNIALNSRMTLNQLFDELVQALAEHGITYTKRPHHEAFRPGDVAHSQADIRKAGRLLGYMPTHPVGAGLREAVKWHRHDGSEGHCRPVSAASVIHEA